MSEAYRKYLDLDCKECGIKYRQQERLFRKAVNKNLCRTHRAPANRLVFKPKAIHLCVDCGKSVCRGSKTCKPCMGKRMVVHREDTFCLCGIQIRHTSTVCISCHNKAQDRGLSYARVKFQNSKGWREIRMAAFERDNHTCQICNVRGGKVLQGHHMKAYHSNPDLRLELSNIQTLCIDCHKWWHSENGRK